VCGLRRVDHPDDLQLDARRQHNARILRVNRRTAERLERVLTAAGVDHDIKEYPSAGHGFLNDHDPSDLPVLFAVMGRLSGTAFDEPAAQDARRIAAFLTTYLKPSQPDHGTPR
jgi:dienelactone hydrolase